MDDKKHPAEVLADRLSIADVDPHSHAVRDEAEAMLRTIPALEAERTAWMERANDIDTQLHDLSEERDALRAEVERLRGIVPEVLENLNDDLCAENETLRAELDALKAQAAQPVAWMDDFGNTFPLGATKGAGSWMDEHKRAWKPLFAAPQAAQQSAAEKLLHDAVRHAEWHDKHIHPCGSETLQTWASTLYLPVPLSESDKSPAAALRRAIERAHGIDKESKP